MWGGRKRGVYGFCAWLHLVCICENRVCKHLHLFYLFAFAPTKKATPFGVALAWFGCGCLIYIAHLGCIMQ